MDIRDRKEQLATDILKLTRLRLQMKLPVMSGALLLPEWKYRNDGKSTGTDGICLYWNPEEVLRWFHDAPIQVERRYLHLVLHCLYLHPLREPAAEKTIWNLACDLMTEYRIDQMAVQGFQRPVPAERSRCYRKLQEAHIAFREQAVTIWLEADCTMQERKELETVFSGDDHALWKSGGMENNPIVRYEQMPGRAEQLRKQVEVIHRWRTIFEELPVREQEHKRQAGGSAGQQVQTMVPGEDREYDYRRFLQRYAVWGEELESDMDSFDYLPYYYSRSHYDPTSDAGTAGIQRCAEAAGICHCHRYVRLLFRGVSPAFFTGNVDHFSGTGKILCAHEYSYHSVRLCDTGTCEDYLQRRMAAVSGNDSDQRAWRYGFYTGVSTGGSAYGRRRVPAFEGTSVFYGRGRNLSGCGTGI